MKIVGLGDSFTEGFLVHNTYLDYLSKYGYETINMGKNGDTSKDLVTRFKSKPADLLIIFVGTNNFLNNGSVEEALMDINSIIEISKAENNLVIIPPLIEEEDAYPIYKMVNESINAYANEITESEIPTIDARFIEPSYIDGIHMREEFHEKLAMKIKEYIEN